MWPYIILATVIVCIVLLVWLDNQPATAAPTSAAQVHAQTATTASTPVPAAYSLPVGTTYSPPVGTAYTAYTNSALVNGTISSVSAALDQCAETCTKDPSCYAFGYSDGRCYKYEPNIYPVTTTITPAMFKEQQGLTTYIRQSLSGALTPQPGKCIVKDVSECAGNAYYGKVCPSYTTSNTCNSVGCCTWTL